MIDVVLWILRVAVLGVAGWLIYWFAIRIQLLLNYAEQLFGVARELLALVPGKSAARTVAPDDVVPKKWWRRLLPDMVPVDDAESPTDEIPVVRTDTATEMQALTAGVEAAEEHAQQRRDTVDQALARFSTAAGPMRPSPRPRDPSGGA